MQTTTDIADLLGSLSPARRALLEQRLGARDTPSAPALERRKPTDPRVLSCAQQQLCFIHQMSPDSPAYNVPYAVYLKGAIDIDALQKALDAVVGRHEILRTMYLPFQGRIIPAVPRQWSVPLEIVDLSSLTNQDDCVQAVIKDFAEEPFDLSCHLKIRCALYRLTDDTSIFMHVTHHIAWDLQSRTVFYRELDSLYDSFQSGAPCRLPEPDLQYADYALWQHKHLQGKTLQTLMAYWKQKLADGPTALKMPADFPRPAVQSMKGERLPLQLSAETLNAARALANDSRVTLYMALLASYFVFLYSYSGQGDICVGSPFDERRNPQLEPLIGMFINTLVLRAQLTGEMTFIELMGQIRNTVLQAIDHQDLPFEKVVEAVQPPRDLSRMLLFQANFRLQGEASPPLHLSGVETQVSKLVDNATSKFDLALELPSTPATWGYLEYSTSIFSQVSAQLMVQNYQELLKSLLARPEAPIGRLETVAHIQARY